MEDFKPKEVIPTDSPIVNIECKSAWDLLTQKEQMYCYYFAKAIWAGQRSAIFQKSYEAPGLYLLLQVFFSQDMQELQDSCRSEGGLSEVEWQQIVSYAAAVFNNAGNYKSFGDTKFIPELPKDKFWSAITHCKHYEEYKDVLDPIWEMISKEVYSEDPPYYKIGFHGQDAASAYYTSNVSKQDAEFVDKFMTETKDLKHVVSPINTWLFKHEDGSFELKIHSTKRQQDGDITYLKTYEFEGKKIMISNGHLDFIAEDVAKYLKFAQRYAHNERRQKVIGHYISHFTTGEETSFRQAMIEWVQDINPTIESEIGFQECYLDPLGVRAEYEGMLAVVDKQESMVYTTLVDNAEKLIEYFPWPKDFENEKFVKPDFTSIKVINLGGSGVCLGQNLPNYDDIRQDYGFKNYSLTNAVPKVTSKTAQFTPDDVAELCAKYFKEALDLKVALHELVGHGSGKLLIKNTETGKFNFDIENVINPLTGEKVDSYYLSSDTWQSKFKKLHSAYEECRADTVAMYLANFKEPFEIMFPDRESEWDDIYYVMWYQVISRGVAGLMYYDDTKDQWGQAHIIGNHVIMKVIYEAGDILEIKTTEKDGKEYFYVHLDREKFKTEGHEAIKKFLQKLHILKCTGDYETAQKWFGDYMKVDDFFLKIRSIVLENKQPRRLELQPNLFLTHDGSVEYRLYDETHEGIVRSYIERAPDILDVEMYEAWIKDAHKFRIPTS